MKADRADYADIKTVRVNVMSVFEHKTQQFLTSITEFTMALLTAKYKMLHDISGLVKTCPIFCSETRTLCWSEAKQVLYWSETET